MKMIDLYRLYILKHAVIVHEMKSGSVYEGIRGYTERRCPVGCEDRAEVKWIGC